MGRTGLAFELGRWVGLLLMDKEEKETRPLVLVGVWAAGVRLNLDW